MPLISSSPSHAMACLLCCPSLLGTQRMPWRQPQGNMATADAYDKTEIRFTHEGLVPEYECFNVCSNAWGSYINGSLRSLIRTGEGYPNPREKGNAKKASR